MATLSAAELQKIRNQMAANGAVVTWTKAQVNAGAQACENLLPSNASGSAAIDTGMSPVVLSNTLKRVLMAAVCQAKYDRDK